MTRAFLPLSWPFLNQGWWPETLRGLISQLVSGHFSHPLLLFGMNETALPTVLELAKVRATISGI